MTRVTRWVVSRWRQSLVLSLTLLAIVAAAAIAVVLSHVVGDQIRQDAFARGRQSAELVGRSSFGPRLPQRGQALTRRARQELDSQMAAARASQPGTEAVLRAADGRLLYSSAPGVARRAAPERFGTRVVGRGGDRRMRTVVPVRAGSVGSPLAYLQWDLSYEPVAHDIATRTRRLNVLLGIGALLLYLLALPSLVSAGRAVRSQYDPRRLQLAHDVKRAIKNNELSLAFQPIIEAPDGPVRSVEALVRWQDPRRGPVPPGLFIPVIEQTDAIWDLSVHTFGLAFQQCARWRAEGRDIRIAVNLSGAVLLDSRLIPAMKNLARQYGVDPECLELEITEGVLVHDPAEAVRVLREIAAIGLRVIAIDDFGTGYSSLARLHELPLDTLKIDQSFVKRMGATGDDTIVRSVVDLAHALGLDVIAEGVEDGEVAARLARLGCEYLQGYHVSKPLPAQGLAELFDGPGVPFVPGPEHTAQQV